MNALFAWLWQGAAIALATAALLGAMRRLNAATRHAIWWCALGAVLAAPLVRVAVSGAAPGAVAIGPVPPQVFVLPAPPDSLLAVAIGAWLGTLIVGFVRIAAGLNLLARLKSESTPFDAGRERRLRMWQSAPVGRRRPELRVSNGARTACALGLRRPVILLSRGLVDSLDDEALDQLVMHEYAHLSRGDDWLRLLESAIVSVAGLHPAVKFIARQIDLEREAACDDVVVSRTGGARAYAACLTDAAAIAGRERPDEERQLAPGATGTTPSLRARIVRLLDPRRARTARLAPVAIGAGLLTAAVALAVSHHVAPVLVIDGESRVSVPPVARAIVPPSSGALTAITRGAFEPAATVAMAVVTTGRPDVQPRASRAARPETPSPLLAPSEVVGRLPGVMADAAPAPLVSRSIASGVHTPVAIGGGAIPGRGIAAGSRAANMKWSSLGAPGVAIGRGARSIAGFFGGAAKAVATSF